MPCFFVGFFGAGTTVPAARAVVSWFDNNRALAVGAVTGLISLGAALAPLLAGALIDTVGWRATYSVMALISATVSVTMVTLFVRARAERHDRGRLLQETQVEGRAISLELPGPDVTQGHPHPALLAHRARPRDGRSRGDRPPGPPRADDDRPWPEQRRGGTLLVIFGLASPVGRVAGGFVIDRVHGSVVGPIVMLAPIAGMLLLHPPFSTAAVAVALVGVASGIEGDLLALLITRYLGTRNFGAILGPVQAVFLLGSAFGPLLLGLAYDELGSYDPVIPVLVVVLVIGATLIATLGRYTYPAVRGFDQLAARDELAASQALSEIAESSPSHIPARRPHAHVHG